MVHLSPGSGSVSAACLNICLTPWQTGRNGTNKTSIGPIRVPSCTGARVSYDGQEKQTHTKNVWECSLQVSVCSVQFWPQAQRFVFWGEASLHSSSLNQGFSKLRPISDSCMNEINHNMTKREKYRCDRISPLLTTITFFFQKPFCANASLASCGRR